MQHEVKGAPAVMLLPECSGDENDDDRFLARMEPIPIGYRDREAVMAVSGAYKRLRNFVLELEGRSPPRVDATDPAYLSVLLSLQERLLTAISSAPVMSTAA